MREVPIPPHITILFVEQEVRTSPPRLIFLDLPPRVDYRRLHNRSRLGSQSRCLARSPAQRRSRTQREDGRAGCAGGQRPALGGGA